MPSPLLERLDQTAAEIRRTARSAIVRTTAAAGVGVAILLVLVDWLGRFHDPGLRWLFTATLVGVTAWVGRFAWRRLRPTGATRLGVAQRLQAIQPALGSRLASAVEFAAGEADDPSAGSAELRRAVVLDATNGAEDLPYGEVIDRIPVRRATRWLVACAAAMGTLGVVSPTAVGSGLYRLALPWADAPWPRSVELEVAEAPELLARGADFEATASNRLGPIPDDTRVEYRTEKGVVRDEPTRLVGDRAIASRESVDESFAYRFRGGDDNTMRWREVEVVEAPRAEELSVAITPPTYSGLPARKTTAAIRVLAGTRLDLAGVSSEPLSTAELAVEGPSEPTRGLTLGEGERFGTGEKGFLAVEPIVSNYRVRLHSDTGVTGEVGPHRYEVLADSPPEVVWSRATDNATVPPGAVIPIAARVTDDLATRTVELEWSLQQAGEPLPQRVTLADRGTTPPAKSSLDEPDKQEIDTEWDLASLDLKPGDLLAVTLVATDYRPQEGRTASPGRVAIVTEDEFLQRIAEKQSRLLGQLQQAIATQRGATQANADLESETRDAARVDQQTLDQLTSIEFQQREASAAVEDPTTGAAATARLLLEELRRSRVEAADLDRQLASAEAALGRLAKETLPAARGELAAARRAGQRDAKGEFLQRLTDGQLRQREAVEGLEAVAESLSGWADYQRFAAEAAELERLQREFATESRKAATEAAAGLAGPSQADRAKRITRQAEANRRFEKLRQAMRRLLQSTPEGDELQQSAESVRDAFAEADDADVAGSLRRAATSLARSRDGDASRAQERAADGLRQMLDALRRRATTDPSELIARLEEEKKKLEELKQLAEQLRDAPDTRPNRSARQRASERAGRQSRRLERLTAQRAAESARRGADRAGERGPSPREQLAEAAGEFEQAQRDIDRRIRELQNELTQRLLNQLAEKIGGYLERQESVLDETLGLANQVEQGESIAEPAKPLALNQRDLSDELGGFADKLARRSIFEMALREAATTSGRAARRLAGARVGRATQRLETTALQRLKQVQEVLRQNQQDQENQQQQGGGGGGGGGQQQPPSLIDVAELKMLRLMQLELLDATDNYEADTSQIRSEGAPPPPGWDDLGRELAGRQKRLTELALELANRDNESEADSAK